MTRTVAVTSGAFSGSFLQIARSLDLKTLTIRKFSDIENADVIVFSGGEDINPKIYGKQNTHSYITQFSIARDIFEMKVLENAIKLSKKILGVCRGHQLINAFLGGNLIQEISLIGSHGSPHKLEGSEGVIKHFFKSVNSMHHQGVLKEGAGLTPTSHYKGVIESTESENIITVQFHPEVMKDTGFFKYIFSEWR